MVMGVAIVALAGYNLLCRSRELSPSNWRGRRAVLLHREMMKLSRQSASVTALSSTRRQTIGARRLFSEAANATCFSAMSEVTKSGLSTNTTLSAFPISAPPLVEGIELAAIDQRLQTRGLSAPHQGSSEGQVLSRVESDGP